MGDLITVTDERDIRPLTPHEFEQFRKLAYEQFGLDLRHGKEQLVSSRLNKRMRELKIRSYKEYYQYVQEDGTGEALIALIDVLTTNHTSFFREPAHFAFLRDTILPKLRERERIQIWSAACSSGEEPYSIAFSLLQDLGMEALGRIAILATDISTRVLENAKRGIYGKERFREVPAAQLREFLLRGEGDWVNSYRVRPPIRNAITFTRLNLMEPFTHGLTFPVIFCRNVMIYFDRQTQENLVKRLSACLEPGGHLFIGHAESLNGLDVPLKYVRPAVYRKPELGESAGRGRR